MKTITNIMNISQPALSGFFRTSALAVFGVALVFVMGLALPHKAEAQAVDFGYGDCSGCGGYTDTYFPASGGYSETYFPASGGYSETYFPASGGYSDTYFPASGGYSDSYFLSDGGYSDTYFPSSGYSYYGSYRNYYQQPYRTNYYDYYSTPSYNYSYNPPSYNNNENTNVNNNNVHVNVDNGGNNHDNRSCSDFGQIGNYPNCRNRDNNNDDDEPSCDLNASDTSVDEGDDIILEWDTEDADYASINQGIGRVDEDGGDIRVEIEDNDDVTFRMTVRDNDGDEDTCSVTIRVDEDNNNDFSSVSFDSGPVSNPPVVYLSDLPYTGIEDITPSMIGFWGTLAALLGIGGYFVFFKRSKIHA